MATWGIQSRLLVRRLLAARAEHAAAARVTRRAEAQCGHPAQTRRW